MTATIEAMDATDDELEIRDARVIKMLANELSNIDSELRTLEDQAAALKRARTRITHAVLYERFYELSGHVSAKDVESLCNVSPDGHAMLMEIQNRAR
jgi:hypothetical protein